MADRHVFVLWSRARALARAGALGLVAWLAGAATWGAPQASAEPLPVDEALRELRGKYKDNDKKYEALLAKIDKAVRKALASTPLPGGTEEAPRMLAAHPYLVLVDELSQALRAKPAKTAAPLACEWLARYPWDPELELVEGLRYGSDRPVPTHENGFIELGELPEFGAALPEPEVNQYLFGLQEIVGWQASVREEKKQLLFRARTPQDPPRGPAHELPAWEGLRVYLQGSLPEVTLYAMPRLTHLIHARLAELRRVDGKPAPMDEMLALLDAHWNGFTFRTPGSKSRIAVAMPVFSLIADRQGFVYHFQTGAHLGGTGDIPFVSDVTLREYAQALRGQSLGMQDFVAHAPITTAVRDAFWQDCVYLARYRGLVELFVRSILAPTSALPASLAEADFVNGAPTERTSGPELDVPRKHALLLWADAGRDPKALAELLHARMLDLELNRYPKNCSLQRELTHLARTRQSEILAALVARVQRERSATGAPADFEREFSPHATYLDPTSPAASDHLVHSHHAFHALLRDTIRAAATAVVRAELGK